MSNIKIGKYVITIKIRKQIDIDTSMVTADKFDSKYIRQVLSVYPNWVLDGQYKHTPADEMKDYLTRNNVSNRIYYPDEYDCDNFALETFVDVKSDYPLAPFGMVIGKSSRGTPHAWNCYINSQWKLWFVEPQTDKWFEPSNEEIWTVMI